MAKNQSAVQASKVEPVTNPTPTTEVDYGGATTTSGKIRWLAAHGKTRSEIAKTLNIRYQHVRNVLIQPLKSDQPKKAETETVTEAETQTT